MSVYAIQADTLLMIKIGHSHAPQARLAQIQAMSPDKLSLLVLIPGGKETEVALHREWDHLRSHGEWFHSTPELIAWLLSQAYTIGELQTLIDHLTDIIKGRLDAAA